MKNFKGGYKIISLEGNDLSTSFSVTGIYNALTETYQKTILVTGIVISGEKKNDAYTEVNIDSDDYKFTIYGYEVTIADDDSVEAEAVTLDAVTSIGGVSGEITLGTGLAITEEGELSVSGGGDKIYMHCADCRNTNSGSEMFLRVMFITKSSTPFTTVGDLTSAIMNAQVEQYRDTFTITGIYTYSSKIYYVIKGEVNLSNGISIQGRDITALGTSNDKTISSTDSVDDYVYEVK